MQESSPDLDTQFMPVGQTGLEEVTGSTVNKSFWCRKGSFRLVIKLFISDFTQNAHQYFFSNYQSIIF